MKKIFLSFIFSLAFVLSACGGVSAGDNSSSNGGNASTEDTVEHVDSDDDGVCDECNASVLTTFDFYAVNDLHGKLDDGENHPGVDELTTYLRQAKANNPNTVLISSGDMWQGAAASNLTKGHIITDWMNDLGFDAMAMGNHEYDWGEEYIESNAEIAQFPFLAINIYDRETNERVDYCDASVLVQYNEAKIGIIGAIGDCYSSISADKSQGVYFKTGDDLTQLVRAEAATLRAQGADFIVYSLHDDKSGCDIEISNYVDLIFEGHSHQSYVQKDSEGVYHLQGGGDNDGITHARVQINIANEKSSIIDAEYISSDEYKHLPDDPIVDELLDKYEEQIAKASKVVGYTDRYRNSGEILQKVADLYYEIGVETWGDEYEIVLGGGFLSARSPYDLQQGAVTYGDLQNILPFDNQIVLCSISGAKLWDQFFNTSNARYYISYGEYGQEVRENISLTQTYYIITDTYSSTYKPNGTTEIARLDETTFARDLLAEYITECNWGVPPANQEPIEISITEALSIGSGLAAGVSTSQEYIVEGVIVDVPQSTYGNLYIQGENGDQLYIYGLYDTEGTRYDGMTDKPQKGDTVRLQGTITNYQGTKIEIIDAVLLSTQKPSASNDPYESVSKAQFYANYTVATSNQDAYYRSLHGFMSGELTVPDQAPTISDYQPQYGDDYIRNSQTRYSEDGNAYTVVDAYGTPAFTVYKSGAYITLEEVAAYVYAFGTYPANYTEEKNADPEDSIWGEYLRLNHTRFSGDTESFPFEPELPNISGCGGSLYYYEMDIGTTGTDCDPRYDSVLYNDGYNITRGAARLVYGKYDIDRDGVYEVGEWHVFYTYNHYNDFQEYLNYEGGWGEMFGNITGGGTISSKYDYNPTDYEEIYFGLLSEDTGDSSGDEDSSVEEDSSGDQTGITLTSIPDALAIGAQLAENEQTTELYYIQGTIINIDNYTYGNMYIQDEDGNQFYIYGVYDTEGTRYDAMTDKPQVGDTVILYGVIKNYVNVNYGTQKIEMVNAKVYSKQ